MFAASMLTFGLLSLLLDEKLRRKLLIMLQVASGCWQRISLYIGLCNLSTKIKNKRFLLPIIQTDLLVP